MSPKRQTTSIELTAGKTGTNIHRPWWTSKLITKFTKSGNWTQLWTSLQVFKFMPAHWRLSNIHYFIILPTVTCHQFFLTKILGPLLLSTLRAYFMASFPKSNLTCGKKDYVLHSVSSFIFHSPLILRQMFASAPLLIHTEYVLAFDTKCIKNQYTRSNRCEDRAHPWSEKEIVEFWNFRAKRKAKYGFESLISNSLVNHRGQTKKINMLNFRFWQWRTFSALSWWCLTASQ